MKRVFEERKEYLRSLPSMNYSSFVNLTDSIHSLLNDLTYRKGITTCLIVSLALDLTHFIFFFFPINRVKGFCNIGCTRNFFLLQSSDVLSGFHRERHVQLVFERRKLPCFSKISTAVDYTSHTLRYLF